MKQANIAIGNNKFKKVTILVGDSKQGKSTIANLLIGNKLKALQDDETGDVYVQQEYPQEPHIGNMQYNSQTRIPFKYEINAEEMIIDMQGFKDTEGVLLEIVNQFCLLRILNLCDELKIIFVSSISNLITGALLNQSILNLVNMFGDISFMKGCVGICFTKVPTPPKKLEHVKKQLSKFIEEFKNLDPKAKYFLEMCEVSILPVPNPDEPQYKPDLDFGNLKFFKQSDMGDSQKMVINKYSIS
jgi:hypothetical protein